MNEFCKGEYERKEKKAYEKHLKLIKEIDKSEEFRH
jgi:hypothetical protein